MALPQVFDPHGTPCSRCDIGSLGPGRRAVRLRERFSSLSGMLQSTMSISLI